MKTLELDPRKMPLLLQEIAGLSSPLLAMRFARTFGGRKVYMTLRLHSTHPLVRCLGRASAERLTLAHPREDLMVPICKIYLRWIDVRALAILGLKQGTIARRLGITARNVRRLLGGFDPTEYEVNDLVLAVGAHYRIAHRDLLPPPPKPRHREPPPAQMQLALPAPAPRQAA